MLPADAEQVRLLLEACAAEGVAVVPFGGGTSVVGGVEPLRGAHGAADQPRPGAAARASKSTARSLTARLGAGLRGPEAEAALAREGLTLGHFPQSFEYATIGGFAATRSAGQASSGYGRFDALVTSVRLLVAGRARCETLETPHTAAGPALRELVVGSEGALGVIPEVTRAGAAGAGAAPLRGLVSRRASRPGREIVRAMAQDEALPDVIRVSDEEETRISLALSGPRRRRARALFDRYLRLRGVAGGCLIDRRARGRDARRSHGAAPSRSASCAPAAPPTSARAAGRSWERGPLPRPLPARHAARPGGDGRDARDLAHLVAARRAVRRRSARRSADALAAQGTPGLVFCHLSHAYPDGASLYFTFIARARPGAEIEQWRQVKTAACEAIVAAGGTITHHHAIGRDHVPYMEAEVGATGVEALRAVKERLDPAGIMNPGKLLPG